MIPVKKTSEESEELPGLISQGQGRSELGYGHLGQIHATFNKFSHFPFFVKEAFRKYPSKLSWIALRACSLIFFVCY